MFHEFCFKVIFILFFVILDHELADIHVWGVIAIFFNELWGLATFFHQIDLILIFLWNFLLLVNLLRNNFFFLLTFLFFQNFCFDLFFFNFRYFITFDYGYLFWRNAWLWIFWLKAWILNVFLFAWIEVYFNLTFLNRSRPIMKPSIIFHISRY